MPVAVLCCAYRIERQAGGVGHGEIGSAFEKRVEGCGKAGVIDKRHSVERRHGGAGGLGEARRCGRRDRRKGYRQASLEFGERREEGEIRRKRVAFGEKREAARACLEQFDRLGQESQRRCRHAADEGGIGLYVFCHRISGDPTETPDQAAFTVLQRPLRA